MSDHVETSPAAIPEDRVMPAVVYALYLLGFASGGVTTFIGLIVAYANRGGAGPKMESHYVFLIRTFWLLIAWAIIGGALLGGGILFSIILIGIPFALVGGFILSVLLIWFAIRCAMGLIYLGRGEGYPRPRNWLI